MTIDPIGVHPETGLPVYADNIGFKNGQPYVLSDQEYAQRQADIGADAAQRPMREALAAITALEAQVTQRRLREAALTDEGKAWLQNIEDQIAAERARAR
jgi:hypothetical protein